MSAIDLFDLEGRVAVITGGAGLLGRRHAAAIASAKGIPVIVDVRLEAAEEAAREITARFGGAASAHQADITDESQVTRLLAEVLERHRRVDILINNAARNPKVSAGDSFGFGRLETFPVAQWNEELAVGLTGAFLMSRVFGAKLAEQGRGVIVNVASDLAVIAPDQRLYRKEGAPELEQPVKPVTYSVVKTGLLGLTRYLATYWAHRSVRVNAISPGGVYDGQPEVFVNKLSALIPLGRMAHVDEYQGAMLFLCSDASSYMTGTNLVIDGGRSCW